jgi:hypothetical protein
MNHNCIGLKVKDISPTTWLPITSQINPIPAYALRYTCVLTSFIIYVNREEGKGKKVESQLLDGMYVSNFLSSLTNCNGHVTVVPRYAEEPHSLLERCPQSDNIKVSLSNSPPHKFKLLLSFIKSWRVDTVNKIAYPWRKKMCQVINWIKIWIVRSEHFGTEYHFSKM